MRPGCCLAVLTAFGLLATTCRFSQRTMHQLHVTPGAACVHVHLLGLPWVPLLVWAQRHGHTDVVEAWHQGILQWQSVLLLLLGNAFGCGVAALLEKVKRQLAHALRPEDSGIMHETPLLLVILILMAEMYASCTHSCDDTWISSSCMMVPGMAWQPPLALLREPPWLQRGARIVVAKQ